MTTRSMYCATHTRFIKMNLLPNIDGTHESALTQISWRTISSCSDLIDPSHPAGGGRAPATWHMHRTARRGVSGAAPLGLFWRTMMNKRAMSAHDVGLHGAHSTGLSRVSSQYDSIPMDVQNRLQSMGWRIRSSTYALLTRRCESWIQAWRPVQRRVSARYRAAGQADIASVGPHGVCAVRRATWYGATRVHRRRRRSAVALLPQARHGRGRLGCRAGRRLWRR